MNKVIYTNGNTIAIRADNKTTTDIVDIFIDPTNTLMVGITDERYGESRYYILKVDSATEKTWNNYFIPMTENYNGDIQLYGTVVKYDTVIKGNIANIPSIDKNRINKLIIVLCKIKTEMIGNEEIYTTESPTKQLGLDITKIEIPLIRSSWEDDKYLSEKIEAFAGKDYPELTYGKITYKNRLAGLRSIIIGLIVKGYTRLEIRDIVEENDLIVDSSQDYQFAKVYEFCMTLYAKRKIFNQLHKLYGRVRLDKNVDQRTYNTLITIALNKSTNKPTITKTELRRITSNADWNTLQNSLNRLQDSGLIQVTEKEKIKLQNNFIIPLYQYAINTDVLKYNTDIEGVTILTEVTYPDMIYTDVYHENNLQKALGNSYNIVTLLTHGELQTKSISYATYSSLGSTRNNVKKLLDLGIVSKRSEGRSSFYSLTQGYLDILETLKDEQIDSINRVIEGEREYYANKPVYTNDMTKQGKENAELYAIASKVNKAKKQ